MLYTAAVSRTDNSQPQTTLLMLASASPRRRELLGRIGVPFEVGTIVVEERPCSGESPWQYARRTALAKLSVARASYPGRVVLAADTVVDLDGSALGKPSMEHEALQTLEALRGRKHRVHTAVAVGRAGTLQVVVCTSEVVMRVYTDTEIEQYIHSGNAFDKAGAYGIQDSEFAPVERIEGSYSNVVGLPLAPTARLLLGLGLPVRLPKE